MTIHLTSKFVFGGSSAGVSSNLWVPASTPHSYDDEFDTDTISGDWSIRDMTAPGAATFSTGTIDSYDTTFTAGTAVRIVQNPDDRPSWLLTQPPSNSKIFAIYKSITLTTNMLIVARMKFSLTQAGGINGDSTIALALHLANSGNPENANSIQIHLNESDAAEILAESRYVNAGGSPTILELTDVDTQGQALEYVAIHKVGTDYYTWAGTASGNWIFVQKMTSAEVAYTPDLVSIIVSNADATTIGPRILGIDFIRFFETDNFLL